MYAARNSVRYSNRVVAILGADATAALFIPTRGYFPPSSQSAPWKHSPFTVTHPPHAVAAGKSVPSPSSHIWPQHRYGLQDMCAARDLTAALGQVLSSCELVLHRNLAPLRMSSNLKAPEAARLSTARVTGEGQKTSSVLSRAPSAKMSVSYMAW